MPVFKFFILTAARGNVLGGEESCPGSAGGGNVLHSLNQHYRSSDTQYLQRMPLRITTITSATDTFTAVSHTKNEWWQCYTYVR